MDGTQIPRSSEQIPGTSGLKAPRPPSFRVGIHRAQRCLNGAWLILLEAGYRRAVPLRCLPILLEQAVPADVPPCREWEGALPVLRCCAKRWTLRSATGSGCVPLRTAISTRWGWGKGCRSVRCWWCARCAIAAGTGCRRLGPTGWADRADVGSARHSRRRCCTNARAGRGEW